MADDVTWKDGAMGTLAGALTRIAQGVVDPERAALDALKRIGAADLVETIREQRAGRAPAKKLRELIAREIDGALPVVTEYHVDRYDLADRILSHIRKPNAADPEPTDALVERLLRDASFLETRHAPVIGPRMLDGIASRIRQGVARLRSMEKPEPQSAAADALDDICVLIGAPPWEYPGQVVRDVAMELDISLDEMAERLNAATPTDEPEEADDE